MLGSDDRFVKARFLARAVKRSQARAFADDRNVIGAAFGRRAVNGVFTDEPALVMYVIRKTPEEFIPPSVLLPRRVFVGGDQLEVDVVETGPLYALAFTGRDRPAPQGVSIGHKDITAGTLGATVVDQTDGTTCILSNNHVMANGNLAAIGDPILQPGPADGGTTPADDIAKLKRFVSINMSGSGTNTVDAAIAEVANPGVDVEDAVKNGLMTVATSDHPAVGLLFAGGCSRTIMNPIGDVLRGLDIQFPAGSAEVTADIGMNVEKVGRTTEYTSSSITEIDLTVTIGGYPFGSATFDDQIATAWMSDGGDSGSVVCQGGAGGNEDHCGCGSTSAAESLLGVDLDLEQKIERRFRDRYLQHTLVGRYLIDLYFHNERRILQRTRKTRINDDDRAYGRYLYEKYVDDARSVALRPEASELRVEEEHLREARQVLERATPYLADDEVRAAEQLLELANQWLGQSPSELLRMLDDGNLLQRVRDIVASVDFLDEPGGRRGDDGPKQSGA